MNRFLHISFTFNEGMPKVQALEPIFNALAPDWLRYSFNCWIVWTARPASDFLYSLKPALGPSDSILIAKLDLSDRTGWQPKWVWDWMDRKRQLGPPPPPAAPPADLNELLRLGRQSSLSNPFGEFGGLGALGGLIKPPDQKK
jgi:hypothetical protein